MRSGLGAAGAVTPASAIGPIPMPDVMELKDLATPALVVDVGLMEANLRALQAFHADTAVSLRPHAKTHKCPVIARRQIELGAVGIAVAKISEAEVMVEGGIDEVLITSPIATRGKLARLLALAGRIRTCKWSPTACPTCGT